MQAAITASSFLAFLSYFAIGLGIMVIAAAIVAAITPHREITLIRQGNIAAATAFAGTLIGIALPLKSVISNSVSLADAAIWGFVAAAVQIAAFLIARQLVAGKLSRSITDNVTAAGIFSAGVSVAIGLINAAAMTP